jgi:hypothetical protein
LKQIAATMHQASGRYGFGREMAHDITAAHDRKAQVKKAH